ncbi:MAG: UMP kinase [bacterium]
MRKETIIISLGGSLVVPNEIDLGFLRNFKHSLEKYLSPTNFGMGRQATKKSENSPKLVGDKRFFILVGGGKVARNYQKALLEFGAKSSDRDWIGINVTILNAEVVKNVFGQRSYPKIITDPNKKVKTTKDIVVGAGWKPGWSTDYVAVKIAETYNKKIPTRGSRIHDARDSGRGIGTIINLTNVDYVYDKNPNNFPDAKPLKEVDWKSFERIVGDKWSPGLSMPFDPRASKLAARLKLKVAIINGKNLERLEDFLNNKSFVGTIIQ